MVFLNDALSDRSDLVRRSGVFVNYPRQKVKGETGNIYCEFIYVRNIFIALSTGNSKRIKGTSAKSNTKICVNIVD